jgi:hypothetical protein
MRQLARQFRKKLNVFADRSQHGENSFPHLVTTDLPTLIYGALDGQFDLDFNCDKDSLTDNDFQVTGTGDIDFGRLTAQRPTMCLCNGRARNCIKHSVSLYTFVTCDKSQLVGAWHSASLHCQAPPIPATAQAPTLGARR